MTTIKCHCAMQAFKLRQAMWALCYIPLADTGTVLTVPDMPLAELVEALGQHNLTLEWIDADSANLVKLEERRHAS